MATLLPALHTKKEVDLAIRSVRDKVLVLRFGRTADPTTMQLDHTLEKCERDLAKMAAIFTVEVEDVEVYVKYFDIAIIPCLIFFYNAQHLKADYGTPDHTKWVGAFKEKQDFIDLVEILYKGALHGKTMVTSPIPSARVPKYELIYRGI